jgi:hypothetical protein
MWQRLGLCVVLLWWGCQVLAQSASSAEGIRQTPAAADVSGPEKSAKKSGKKSGKKPSQKSPAPKVLPSGSGETPAERASRLKRECKGLPNAGACTGYAQ